MTARIFSIHDAVTEIRHRQPYTGLRDMKVNCSPAIAIDLHREALDRATQLIPSHLSWVPFADQARHLIGMEVVTDEYLPREAWRLCDSDGTHLYDCREGTSAGASAFSAIGHPSQRVGPSPVAAPIDPLSGIRRMLTWLTR